MDGIENQSNVIIRFQVDTIDTFDVCYIDSVTLTGQSITETPTKTPTKTPTNTPTHYPTLIPTRILTSLPWINSTQLPSISPTNNPTSTPTETVNLNTSQSSTTSPNSTLNPTNSILNANINLSDNDGKTAIIYVTVISVCLFCFCVAILCIIIKSKQIKNLQNELRNVKESKMSIEVSSIKKEMSRDNKSEIRQLSPGPPSKKDYAGYSSGDENDELSPKLDALGHRSNTPLGTSARLGEFEQENAEIISTMMDNVHDIPTHQLTQSQVNIAFSPTNNISVNHNIINPIDIQQQLHQIQRTLQRHNSIIPSTSTTNTQLPFNQLQSMQLQMSHMQQQLYTLTNMTQIQQQLTNIMNPLSPNMGKINNYGNITPTSPNMMPSIPSGKPIIIPNTVDEISQLSPPPAYYITDPNSSNKDKTPNTTTEYTSEDTKDDEKLLDVETPMMKPNTASLPSIGDTNTTNHDSDSQNNSEYDTSDDDSVTESYSSNTTQSYTSNTNTTNYVSTLSKRSSKSTTNYSNIGDVIDRDRDLSLLSPLPQNKDIDDENYDNNSNNKAFTFVPKKTKKKRKKSKRKHSNNNVNNNNNNKSRNNVKNSKYGHE